MRVVWLSCVYTIHIAFFVRGSCEKSDRESEDRSSFLRVPDDDGGSLCLLLAAGREKRATVTIVGNAKASV